MSWNDLLHSGPLPYPWDNFSKSIENEIQKKKGDNLAGWGFGTDQQPQWWYLLALCVHLCRWTTPRVPEVLLQNAKALTPPSRQRNGDARRCLKGSKWSKRADGRTGAKPRSFPRVSEPVLQTPGKLVGFWGYFWEVCCWHKWLLGFRTIKMQLQGWSCLSDCRDLTAGTVNLMEVYVNGELMSWFGFFLKHLISLQPLTLCCR